MVDESGEEVLRRDQKSATMLASYVLVSETGLVGVDKHIVTDGHDGALETTAGVEVVAKRVNGPLKKRS